MGRLSKTQFIATAALKAWREEQELTQAEMADMLSTVLDRSISLSLYQKWEQGSMPVSFKDAVSINRVAEKSFKELWKAKS